MNFISNLHSLEQQPLWLCFSVSRSFDDVEPGIAFSLKEGKVRK